MLPTKFHGSIYGRSSIKIAHFVPIGLQTWPPQAILVSDWLISKKSLWWPYLLTDRDEMSSHYRGSSIDASYPVSVHLAKGFQRRRLKCEKLRPNEPKHGRKHLWRVLYKDCSCRLDPLTNMATTGNSCF
jgi:hypothetical protein